jgi:hypothetical protein
MSMDDQREGFVPLDGNAAAGLLREWFTFDVTAAGVTCGGCAATAQIGEIRVYGGTMGAIFRCAHCDTVIARMVRTPAGLWLDMQGARRLFVRPPQR